MGWGDAVRALLDLVKTIIEKADPAADEISKKRRLQAEEGFKEFVKRSEESQQKRLKDDGGLDT